MKKEKMKTSIDEYDLKIINILNSLEIGKNLSIYFLAKKLFSKLKNSYELGRKDSFIRAKLKKLLDYGLVKQDKEKDRVTYILIPEKCKFMKLRNKKLKINQNSYFLNIGNKWFIFPFNK